METDCDDGNGDPFENKTSRLLRCTHNIHSLYSDGQFSIWFLFFVCCFLQLLRSLYDPGGEHEMILNPELLLVVVFGNITQCANSTISEDIQYEYSYVRSAFGQCVRAHREISLLLLLFQGHPLIAIKHNVHIRRFVIHFYFIQNIIICDALEKKIYYISQQQLNNSKKVNITLFNSLQKPTRCAMFISLHKHCK